MSRIDLTRLITADAKSAAQAEQRAETIKAECRRRIFAVADDMAQINLAAAAAAGALDDVQMRVYRSGLAWVAEMRGTCRVLMADPERNPGADAEWPGLPDGLVGLAGQF